MAKRTTTNKADQYKAIMEKEGVREYKVLAFSFLSETGPEYLHYEIMLADPQPDYYLFDIMGEIAQIVVPKDVENDAIIIRLAESCGGQKTTPNLR